MATGGSFLRVKRPGREADHLPPSSTEGYKWAKLCLCFRLYVDWLVIEWTVLLCVRYTCIWIPILELSALRQCGRTAEYVDMMDFIKCRWVAVKVEGMYVWRNTGAFTKPLLPRKSGNICRCMCLWACSLTYQYATRSHHIVHGLSVFTILFPHYHKRHDSRKKKLLSIKCVFWFSLQLLSKTFLILRRI